MHLSKTTKAKVFIFFSVIELNLLHSPPKDSLNPIVAFHCFHNCPLLAK